jgi:hypothetical protein
MPYDLDVVQYMSAYILRRADDYSNCNISRFLTRPEDVDTNSDVASNETDDAMRTSLLRLMPRDTMVTDLWCWDIRTEDESFSDLAEIAFLDGDELLQHAAFLADDFLRWIDDFAMDYNQNEWEPAEFEEYVKEQCTDFMRLATECEARVSALKAVAV